jgi:lysine/ornithine N-monooxygenase
VRNCTKSAIKMNGTENLSNLLAFNTIKIELNQRMWIQKEQSFSSSNSGHISHNIQIFTSWPHKAVLLSLTSCIWSVGWLTLGYANLLHIPHCVTLLSAKLFHVSAMCKDFFPVCSKRQITVLGYSILFQYANVADIISNL